MIKEQRYTELDGLRGLAAFVVVVHHAFLVSPGLADSYQGQRAQLTGGWWLTHTPLHLVWDGPAAVIVFFVLSGFVLTLPFLREQPALTWRSYYPRRLVRLYVPTIASVLVAVATVLVFGRAQASSWWISDHELQLTAKLLAQDAVLLFGTSSLNSPLWSLRWEVFFSLLLPLYVVAARRWLALPGIVACLALIHYAESDYLHLLPVFALGSFLAAGRHDIARWAPRLPRAVWPALLVVAFACLNSPWYPVTIPPERALTAAGALLLVAVFAWWPGVKPVATHTIVQWLGRISFSLYLVHEPIVVSIAQLTRSASPWVSIALSAPVALAVAAAFYRWVEVPAHRASRQVGVWADGRRRAA